MDGNAIMNCVLIVGINFSVTGVTFPLNQDIPCHLDYDTLLTGTSYFFSLTIPLNQDIPCQLDYDTLLTGTSYFFSVTIPLNWDIPCQLVTLLAGTTVATFLA